MRLIAVFIVLSVFAVSATAQKWIKYEGGEGAGKGKHIVLVSGDEEYRSEEALPMLARILSKSHGFTCTVLFSIDPATGQIDPMKVTNIPGLENLRKADLLLIFTRFRALPDSQMKYFDEYLKAGRPVIGLRTATHAFNFPKGSTSSYSRYSYNSQIKGWEKGFGKKILGETWVNHHGHHGEEGTRALVNGIEERKKNPILNGVRDIWVPTDVYSIDRLDKDARVLLYGQSTSGMTDDAPANLEKSVMPVAWTKTYTLETGKIGKVFTTTMGASVDFLSEDLRRLVVNACLWAVGLEKSIPQKANVDFVGEYKPTMFGFSSFVKGVFPADMK